MAAEVAVLDPSAIDATDCTEQEKESSDDDEADEEMKNLDSILRLDSTATIEDLKSKDAPLELKNKDIGEPSSLE